MKTTVPSNVNVIPIPAHMKMRKGTFAFHAESKIVAENEYYRVARYLSDVLFSAMGMHRKVNAVNNQDASAGGILFLKSRTILGREEYVLDISEKRIEILASNPAGAFYACQTLRQLLPDEVNDQKLPKHKIVWEIPCLKIEDRPRFSWRGLMLDPARHFLTKDFLKRYIDILAYYKMNRLHLHLTDNEGWTIEIKKYPQLTEMKRWLWAPKKSKRGIYRQADIRDIVAYAKHRHITIIPEIEMPAHSITAVLAKRDLLCPNNPWRKARKDWRNWPELDPGCDIWPDRNLIAAEYCLGNEKTFEFFDHVLSEITNLFPSPWIHIGGDEYLGNTWAQCPLCKKRIRALAGEDSHKLTALHKNCSGDHKKYLLYRYGMRRIAQMVVAKGRIPIMWDNLAWCGKYPAGVVVDQWHTAGGRDEYEKVDIPGDPVMAATRNGHEVIISAYSHLYFDDPDPKNIISLEKVYELEPIPHDLEPRYDNRILGAHALVWAQPQEKVDRQVFPRLLALAELNWSPPEMRNIKQFRKRLTTHNTGRKF